MVYNISVNESEVKIMEQIAGYVYVVFSELKYQVGTNYGDWSPHYEYEKEIVVIVDNEDKAKEISTILRGNWDYYEEHMNAEYGCTALKKGWEYWYRDGIYAGFENATYYINLSTGETDWDSFWNLWDERSALFYMESGQKM